jgi:hypothetical protein
MMPKEEKIKAGIYLLVFTSPITHTYLYNIDTKGTLGSVWHLGPLKELALQLPGFTILYKTKEQLAGHYYSTSSGESRVKEEGTSDTSES